MRFLVLLLISVLLISCGRKVQEESYRIAIFVSGEGRAKKVEGFLQGLKDLGLHNLRVEIYKGDNTLRRIRNLAVELFQRQEDYHLIAVGGSLEAHMLRSNGKLSTPVVILGGTSILAWKLTKELSAPSEGITGVDNLNAELMEKRMELFSQTFPDIKKVLVFCTPKFEASKRATKITVRSGKKFHIKVVPVSVADVKELEYIISNMKEDGFGAIMLTPCFYTENFLTSYILHYANFYQIPVFCHSPELVRKGCHVAYGTPSYEQGYQASHMAYRILKGARVEDVPFERTYYPRFAVNERAIEELSISYNRQIYSLADEVIR